VAGGTVVNLADDLDPDRPRLRHSPGATKFPWRISRRNETVRLTNDQMTNLVVGVAIIRKVRALDDPDRILDEIEAAIAALPSTPSARAQEAVGIYQKTRALQDRTLVPEQKKRLAQLGQRVLIEGFNYEPKDQL
jgi:hypothetical protein